MGAKTSQHLLVAQELLPARRVDVRLASDPTENVAPEDWQILATRPKRRHLDGEDGDPVEEVGVEDPSSELIKGAVCRADEPERGATFYVLTHAVELPLLDRSNEETLGILVDVGDLVEEQAVPVCELESPDSLAGCAGERVLGVPEQLGAREVHLAPKLTAYDRLPLGLRSPAAVVSLESTHRT
ncbi:MAG: hypothetical protein IPI35_29860 [Deltaproteobacteria bacterium]|nr:hypothetical protein [Deltaproteobacteria bacterium]